MGYYDVGSNPLRNRRRRKKTRFNGVLLVGIAFLAFIAIGIIISVSIRACTHRVSYSVSSSQYVTPHLTGTNSIAQEQKSIPQASSTYTMPDSIIRICTPKPLEGVPEQILRKSSYITSYNKDTKLPNWVAWNLSGSHTDGPYKRMSNFYEDEDVPYPKATLDDYRGSGWSRGHMCPAGDNKWNEDAMYDTFSLTNVCPQNANLNSGLWNSIEMDCRRWARRFNDIYIVCGPIFMNREHEAIGANNVLVPEAFFKVVLCLNGKPKGIGFIVRNTDGTKKRDLYYNSIDQVERITGMDFFPALPDDIENVVEATADINDWD